MPQSYYERTRRCCKCNQKLVDYTCATCNFRLCTMCNLNYYPIDPITKKPTAKCKCEDEDENETETDSDVEKQKRSKRKAMKRVHPNVTTRATGILKDEKFFPNEDDLTRVEEDCVLKMKELEARRRVRTVKESSVMKYETLRGNAKSKTKPPKRPVNEIWSETGSDTSCSNMDSDSSLPEPCPTLSQLKSKDKGRPASRADLSKAANQEGKRKAAHHPLQESASYTSTFSMEIDPSNPGDNSQAVDVYRDLQGLNKRFFSSDSESHLAEPGNKRTMMEKATIKEKIPKVIALKSESKAAAFIRTRKTKATTIHKIVAPPKAKDVRYRKNSQRIAIVTANRKPNTTNIAPSNRRERPCSSKPAETQRERPAQSN